MSDIRSTTPDFGRLTKAEQEVLALLTQGLLVGEIAEQRQVGVGTIRSQVKSIHRTLRTSSIAQAVATAYYHGYAEVSA